MAHWALALYFAGLALHSSHARSTLLPDDALTWLQAAVQVELGDQRSSKSSDIMRALSRSADAPVDCVAHPALCGTPFNCLDSVHSVAAVNLNAKTRKTELGSKTGLANKVKAAALEGFLKTRVATESGHSNMNRFCGSQEQFAMLECLAGNLSGYAQLKRLEKPRGEGNLIHRTVHDIHHDMIAQYCFNLGHCDDNEAHDGMSLEQGEAMCDKEYGQAWSTYTAGDLERERFFSQLRGSLQVYMFTADGLGSMKLGQPSSRTMAKMSCAEGHYHCDVFACKEIYCKDEGYWKKYHNRLPGQ